MGVMTGQWMIAALALPVSLGLGACASPDRGLAGQRTVFSNPYVPPVIETRGIGPACDIDARTGSVCTSGGLVYPGRGRVALLPTGELVRLNRAERRFLRDRADALEAQRDLREALANGTPLPPDSPALPQNQRGYSPPPPPSPPAEPPARDDTP